MPRRYSKRKPYRRTTRRPRKAGKRRFTKRKFSRSSALRMRVPGTTIPQTMNVKLPYTKEFRADLSITTGLWADVYHPSGTRTFPVVGQASSIVFLGSHCCTPLFQPSSATTSIEDYPSGIHDWSQFYSEAICHGSSISVQIQPSDPIVAMNTRWILLPIASDDSDDLSTPNDATNNTRAVLDALPYADLMSYPGAKSGYIKHMGAGSTYVKAFRKTKHMLGIKDVIDSQGSLSMTLPTAADPNAGKNPTGTDTTCWLWYFRVFAYSTAVQSDIMFTFRLNYYLQLQTRKSITQLTTVSA